MSTIIHHYEPVHQRYFIALQITPISLNLNAFAWDKPVIFGFAPPIHSPIIIQQHS
jgi:hypothetical protein